MSDSLRVELITSDARLDDLRTEWEALDASVPRANVFASYGWTSSWWRHFGRAEPARRETSLYLLAAWHGDRLCGVLPLVRRLTKRLGGVIRRLEFPDQQGADYMEPVVAGDAAPIVAAFVGFLEEHTDDWDVLIVRRLHPDAEIGQILAEALRGSTLHARAHDDEAYLTVPTDGGWQGVLASRSAKSRAAMSRQLKKLDAEIRGGKLRAEVVERPDLQPSLLDRMAELEARRAKRGVPAGSLVAAYRPFFADVFAALGPRGHLYVSTVEFEGALIAYELGFRGPTAIMAYTRAFDIAHAKLVPGVLLSRLGVEFSVRSGAGEYDFLRGAEEFKRRLGGQPRALLRLDVWSRTRRSRVAALLYFRLRRRALRAAALLPLVQIDTQDL